LRASSPRGPKPQIPRRFTVPADMYYSSRTLLCSSASAQRESLNGDETSALRLLLTRSRNLPLVQIMIIAPDLRFRAPCTTPTPRCTATRERTNRAKERMGGTSQLPPSSNLCSAVVATYLESEDVCLGHRARLESTRAPMPSLRKSLLFGASSSRTIAGGGAGGEDTVRP
jgi:hypothetical protein